MMKEQPPPIPPPHSPPLTRTRPSPIPRLILSSLPPLLLLLLAFLLLPSPIPIALLPPPSISPAAHHACAALSAALPSGTVLYPLSLPYALEVRHSWSLTLHTHKPACAVRATSAAHVATAVLVLGAHPGVEVAVKSGGHDPSPGHASTRGGVLVSLRKMKGATYDPASGLAEVRPGGCWNDVVRDLERHGRTVVGGRLGAVGVGGYLVQGGLSFLTAQYGLAADNVVAWEVVMANGSVVTIMADAHPELARAMRGGGNQFGIVTKFTVRTHPIGLVHGGMRVWTSSSSPELYTKLNAFVKRGAADPKGAFVFSESYAYGGVKYTMLFYCYDGADMPTTGPFAELLDVPAAVRLGGRMKYSTLLRLLGYGAVIPVRMAWRTATIPVVSNNTALFDEISTQWRAISGPYLHSLSSLTSICGVEFQPFPSLFGAHNTAARGGGNAMGLSAVDPDRLVLELQCAWTRAQDDARVMRLLVAMTDWLDAQLPRWNGMAGLRGDAYMPLFMNDAGEGQDVAGSYRDRDVFGELQRGLDKEGMWRVRVGGYKF